ncbi:MAG: NfeD family protein [Phycisphaerae bacterium]|jgi:membrane-bound serine protease (ClpP class)|nr:NfeD family protein [Phycisphaerae bacterium]
MEPLMIVFLLLVAAMVLAFLEILTPSFGLLAVGAVGTLIGAIWMGFSYASWLGYTIVVGSIVLGPAYVAFLVRLLPNTPLGKRMFLAKAPDATGDGTPQADTYDKMVGKTGTAVTLLRPGGMVQIADERVPAHAETGMIEKDTPIVVVGADSMNVIVRTADIDT